MIYDNLKLSERFTNQKKVQQFATKFALRLIPKRKKHAPFEWVRFLGGVTPNGVVAYSKTIDQFYKNVVVIDDKHGAVAGVIMDVVRKTALDNGHEIITLKNLFLPSKLIDHILIPELSLAFVREYEYIKFSEEHRRIHARRFYDVNTLRAHRPRITFNRRVTRELLLGAIETLQKASGVSNLLKNKSLWLCVIAIFFGGAAEMIMTQWCSSYLEQSLGITKIWGDLLGMALFAACLGLGRVLYTARGKNISRVLILGSIGAFLCYIMAAITNIAAVGIIACVFTGFCVSMLWPGSILVSSDKFPSGGVFIFAMMASGGDLGAAVGPQLLGAITDKAMTMPIVAQFASNLSITVEQLSMKIGILTGSLFPLLAIPFMVAITRKQK